MDWQIDPVHSSVGFSVKHMMVSTVRGRFGAVRGSLGFDPETPETARAEVRIEAASVDTAMRTRDEHLRSPDFFDAERHPEIVFRVNRTRPLGGDRYRVEGDLTIRGVTRPVALEAELAGLRGGAGAGARVGISARGTIDRSAFGLNWNQALEAGGVLVSDRVQLEVEIEAVRAAVAAAA